MKKFLSISNILFLYIIGCLFIIILVVDNADAKRNHHEKWYQDLWAAAHGGYTEVVLESGARCDILTNTHAIEVDFADKWAEGLGQSLHYASQTGKRAAVLLIMESKENERHYERLKSTIEYHKLPVDIWRYEAY